MSLDLLKERFGGTKSTDKKEADKQKLNEMFISKPVGDIKSFKAQYQDELLEKDRVIENLKQELNSQWLTNQTAFNTKKLYEDKIKKMNIVDSTNLIPTLVEVSKQKQGNVKLDWISWLEIPESNYLFQINESLAKKIFQENNLLIDRLKYKQRGAAGPNVENYNIRFGGAEGNRAFVRTNFNPDTFSLNLGYTVSYWVRPDEVGDVMFAFGRRHNSNQRFAYGINTSKSIYAGFGGKQLRATFVTMGATTNPNLSYLFNDDNSLKTGNWIHFAATYENRTESGTEVDHKLFMNGELIRTTSEDWSQGGGGTSGMFLGARNNVGDYNNGWACGLDELAIYDTDKGTSFAQEVYNGGINYDHKGASNLVGYWKMNENGGTTVIDHSGNGNHGTLDTDGTGLPTWEEIKGY